MDSGTAYRRVITVVLVGAVLASLAACSPTDPAPTAAPSPSPEASAAEAPSVPPATPTPLPTPDRPLASSGTVAILGDDGSLWLVDATGSSSLLSSADEGTFAFPAWSPDGRQLAAIRYGATENAILVFTVGRGAPADGTDPVVILRSSSIGPFYLSWTPDGRYVSYLANESGGLSLRLAPAAGGAPLDGTGPGAIIKTGNPFYFDWIDGEQLLVHVGAGTEAFIGEIGLDGDPTAAALTSPGDFRPAVVSPDRTLVGYVRAGDAPASEVVVSARDGSGERSLPVFGSAAVTFDPTGNTLATIGPIEPPATPLVIPLGPLRLIGAQADQDRTLLDGSVVSFWWSPDGETIAALRVQPVAGPASSASPLPSPSGAATEIRLLFVDVASGNIRSSVVVAPGQLFIDQFLTFFDQYALSHELWAPDSSSLLLPVVDADGTTRVAVLFRDGTDPVMIEGQIGFWSP